VKEKSYGVNCSFPIHCSVSLQGFDANEFSAFVTSLKDVVHLLFCDKNFVAVIFWEIAKKVHEGLSRSVWKPALQQVRKWQDRDEHAAAPKYGGKLQSDLMHKCLCKIE
jgi:hypothetical protein